GARGRAHRLRARVPVRLARRPRHRAALLRRAHLRPQRARLRPAQHALAHAQPLLPASPARRRPRRLARRADLGRAEGPPGDRARLHPDHRRHRGEGRHPDALLRDRAHAVRPALPGRRRRPHRAAHRRQGPQPGRRRRAGADRGARRVLRDRLDRTARRLLRRLPQAGLAGPALLLVDDDAAAHLRLRRRLRAAAAALLPGLRDLVRGGRHHVGGELRRLRMVTRRTTMTHPPYLSPGYKSTVLRAPSQPPVAFKADPDAIELTSPVFGHDEVAPLDADLTEQHDGEPIGERITVTGRVLASDGRPVRGTLAEVWQANSAGRYAHAGDQHPAPLDPNFTGAGRCLTDDEGRYRFTTIKPGAY